MLRQEAPIPSFVGWSVGWLVGWLVGRLIGWSVGSGRRIIDSIGIGSFM
jgi:hypothetical protein